MLEYLAVVPIWLIIILAFFSFLFFIAGGALAYWGIQQYRWNWKADIWENTDLGFCPTRKDKARLVGFGDGGEEVFYLKKHKKFRPAYGKKIGTRRIAWGIADDGYWYDISFEGLDKKLRQIGVQPTQRSMRLAHSSMRKGLQGRYQPGDFMQKYGMFIALGILMIIILAQAAGAFFNHLKAREVAQVQLEVSKVNKETLELTERILAQTSTIQQGGSGLVSTPTT